MSQEVMPPLMKKIEWKLIDDFEFVHLAADVLRRLGFIDVHIQGDGPDGGFDLFATELVSFAISGSQPFRWGIQCKFSTSGRQRAVNDREIRDVEGTLRSDRFHAQDLRGYMLITNRRVSQNVLERLAGINRGSPYRTSYIDGTKLQHLLSENPMIIDKYFGEVRRELHRHLGIPMIVPLLKNNILVDTINQKGARVKEHYSFPPSISVDVCVPGGAHKPITITSIIDTGCDISLMSPRVLKMLEQTSSVRLPILKRVRFYTASNHSGFANCFNVDIHILKETFSNVEVVVPSGWDFESYGFWIGWSLLSKLSVLLDGDTMRLWKREK
jgi:hypothetical protein